VALLDRIDTIDIAIDGKGPIGDVLPEPRLATTPFVVEFDEPARLDPKRTALAWLVPRPPRAKMLMRWSLGALALHLLLVAIILGWPVTADEVPVIPVQLVIVEPPPEPTQAPAPAPEQPPPQGRVASDDFGDVTPKDPGTSTNPTPPAASDQEPTAAPTEAQPVATETPPPPAPAPTETQTAALPPPPPVPPPKPTPPQVTHPPKPSNVSLQPQHDQPSHEAPRAAHFAGPTATRDEYLAYLVTLTRQHIDQLPMSVVGKRHGETIVNVVVLNDGTIEHISVAHSSGYADIDERIQRMVAAVGKFPPVPQWFQGRSMELQLTLEFPEALERP
jgi:TonB family protein